MCTPNMPNFSAMARTREERRLAPLQTLQYISDLRHKGLEAAQAPVQERERQQKIQNGLEAKAAMPNLTDTSVGSTAASTSNTGVGSADTSTSGPSRRRRNYTSLYVSSNNTGANT